MNQLIVVLAVIAGMLVVVSPAQADQIRCGNGVYKEAMKNKRILLKGTGVRCNNLTYQGKSAVSNWTRTHCRFWGQTIILVKTDSIFGWAITHTFNFKPLVVYNTCTHRVDFVVPVPR
jgi:hypothetical protein